MCMQDSIGHRHSQDYYVQGRVRLCTTTPVDGRRRRDEKKREKRNGSAEIKERVSNDI